MEKRFIIRDINSKPITALLYHVLRREIITLIQYGITFVILPYVICSHCIIVRISSEEYKPNVCTKYYNVEGVAILAYVHVLFSSKALALTSPALTNTFVLMS